MKRFISFIIIILLLFIFTPNTIYSADRERAAPGPNTVEAPEEGCAATLVNNTNKTYVFWLAWIDHPYLNRGKPWNKTVAEMKPGESFTAEDQSPGLYTIKYREAFHSNLPRMEERFTITAKNKTIIAVLTQEKNKPPILIIFKYDT